MADFCPAHPVGPLVHSLDPGDIAAVLETFDPESVSRDGLRQIYQEHFSEASFRRAFRDWAGLPVDETDEREPAHA